MSTKRIYISCPITLGNRNLNYFQAVDVEELLMMHNFAPLNPAHTMVVPFAWNGRFSETDWLERWFAWIETADAVLRLPGESCGANKECEYANSIGIPVVYSLPELLAWRQKRSVLVGT